MKHTRPSHPPLSPKTLLSCLPRLRWRQLTALLIVSSIAFASVALAPAILAATGDAHVTHGGTVNNPSADTGPTSGFVGASGSSSATQTVDVTSDTSSSPTLDASDSGSGSTIVSGDTLPVERWLNHTRYFTYPQGSGSLLSGVWSTLGGLFLGIGKIAWSIYLFLLHVSGDNAMVTGLYHSANRIFASFASILGVNGGGSPIVLTVAVVGFATIALQFLRRGRGAGVLSQTIMLMLPLAVLIAMSSAAASDNAGLVGNTAGTDSFPAGSPGWFAAQGNRVLGSASFTLVPGNPQLQAADTPGSCLPYVNELYAESADADPLLIAGSHIWEATYLQSYYYSQFGSNAEGATIGCRLLEPMNGYSSSEQQAIQNASDGVFMTGTASLLTSSDLDGDEKTGYRKLSSWAACSGHPEGRGGNDWFLLTIGQGVDNTALSEACGGFLAGGSEVMKPGGGGDPYYMNRWKGAQGTPQSYADAIDGGANRDGVSDEYALAQALTGQSTGTMIFGGMATAASGIVILVALGGLTIALALSSVIVAVGLMFLPVALIAMALPATRSKGKAILIFVGSAIALRFAAMLLLTMMAFLISLINSVFGNNMIVAIVSPVIALVIMRKLLSKVGMSGVMSMKGGMMAPIAAYDRMQGKTESRFGAVNKAMGGRGALQDKAGKFGKRAGARTVAAASSRGRAMSALTKQNTWWKHRNAGVGTSVAAKDATKAVLGRTQKTTSAIRRAERALGVHAARAAAGQTPTSSKAVADKYGISKERAKDSFVTSKQFGALAISDGVNPNTVAAPEEAWTNLLDKHDLIRETNESDDDYTARLIALGAARGIIDENGELALDDEQRATYMSAMDRYRAAPNERERVAARDDLEKLRRQHRSGLRDAAVVRSIRGDSMTGARVKQNTRFNELNRQAATAGLVRRRPIGTGTHRADPDIPVLNVP